MLHRRGLMGLIHTMISSRRELPPKSSLGPMKTSLQLHEPNIMRAETCYIGHAARRLMDTVSRKDQPSTNPSDSVWWGIASGA